MSINKESAQPEEPLIGDVSGRDAALAAIACAFLVVGTLWGVDKLNAAQSTQQAPVAEQPGAEPLQPITTTTITASTLDPNVPLK